MVSNRDLLLGVERGIITQDQLVQLIAITTELQLDGEESQQTSEDEADDEAPRFIRSFGDMFIAIGTGFLGVGLMAAITFLGQTTSAKLGALIIVWITAEWLTGYLRISAPSIVLSILFTGFTAFYFSHFFDLSILNDLNTNAEFRGLILVSISAMCAAGVFYARFRLPFALGIFGLMTIGLLLSIIGAVSSDLLLGYLRWIIGLGGLGLFTTAMWFDAKDPLRKTRLSDCGFWLHLIAAPMLTHAVLWDSHPALTGLQNMFGVSHGANSWLIITIFFVIFGIVALIINRRALLVSSLGYVGSVAAYGIWRLNLPEGSATSVVMLIIATLILAFGVGWKPLRRMVFMALPQGNYLATLPPAHT